MWQVDGLKQQDVSTAKVFVSYKTQKQRERLALYTAGLQHEMAGMCWSCDRS